MFIRWLTYESAIPLSSWRRPKDKRLTAILVESVRVDGKPRQRHIASLASIREDQIINDVGYRCSFWERITRKLDRLRNKVSADDRRRIEAALAKRVPCPTRKQYDQWKAPILERWGPKRIKPALAHWPR
jgi:hypothetical protein